MNTIRKTLGEMEAGDKRALARCITIVENELEGYETILSSLKFPKIIPVIGITGPPGAGKSTLINMILKNLAAEGKTAGVLAVDPTSPFTHGSLLGDRLRMGEHFNDANIFIRSLATRGALGGLSAKSIEITDVMRAFGFDMIILETVGVGQSEVEIAGLADLTILVLVPESGDEVQTIKSGIMEIADIFVVNKSDRPGADLFLKNIFTLVQSKHADTPVIKAVATKGEGVSEIMQAVVTQWKNKTNEKKNWLLAEKAWRLISNSRMKNISRQSLENEIKIEMQKPNFSIYHFVKKYFPGK